MNKVILQRPKAPVGSRRAHRTRRANGDGGIQAAVEMALSRKVWFTAKEVAAGAKTSYHTARYVLSTLMHAGLLVREELARDDKLEVVYRAKWCS